MSTLSRAIRISALALSLALPSVASAQQPAQRAPIVKKHHSLLKGAVVGGVAGHMMGGHGKVGAVVGAMVQHHKNKKG